MQPVNQSLDRARREKMFAGIAGDPAYVPFYMARAGVQLTYDAVAGFLRGAGAVPSDKLVLDLMGTVADAQTLDRVEREHHMRVGSLTGLLADRDDRNGDDSDGRDD